MTSNGPRYGTPDIAPRLQPQVRSRPDRMFWSINVLVVEDDVSDTEIILSVLKRHPRISSTHASSQPIALLGQLATGQLRPDLIFLDIRMPRMDGFKFLEALREIPAMVSVPVVFLTTSALADDARRAAQSTASSYIVKPDTYLELHTRLDGAIKRALSSLRRK